MFTNIYSPDKPTPGQRCVMLVAVDAGGRLPDSANQRVLNSIPESWARTASKGRGRFLTSEGRVALAPSGRSLILMEANPETGALGGATGYFAGLALVRDGLATCQDADGHPVPPEERRGVLRITERGRKLVGMPLTAPAFAERFPVGSQAIREQEGKPALPVTVIGWPFTDGTVRVRPRPLVGLSYAESMPRFVPVEQLRLEPPAPAATVSKRPNDDRRKTMSDYEPTLDDELVALRGLAAAVVEPVRPGTETWEHVKVLGERAGAGYELAERFREFDRRATENRWAPREWGLGRNLSAEEAEGLVEKFPDLAALGTTFVRSLAAFGFAPFQMSSLVKQVQGYSGQSQLQGRDVVGEIRAGDVVEGLLAGSVPPKSVRVKVDRAPWPGGPGSTVLSDGTAVTSVLTASVRVVEHDGPTTEPKVTGEG
ncbi:hypothetical protein LRE75_03130 [Streptomyces sp. 372A]